MLDTEVLGPMEYCMGWKAGRGHRIRVEAVVQVKGSKCGRQLDFAGSFLWAPSGIWYVIGMYWGPASLGVHVQGPWYGL